MGVCCVPGCSWHSRKAKATGTVRHFFVIRRPDLGKTAEEKAHRETLRKIILSLRDPTKGDTIIKQLAKESATICDVHFDETDIVKTGSKYRLRTGAVPIHNMPKKLKHCSTPRKPPAVRGPLKLSVNHRNQKDIWKSVNKLSPGAKGNWIFYDKGDTLVAELQQKNEFVPQIRLEFGHDAELSDVSFYGWIVCTSNIGITSLQFQTLYAYLREFESIEMCQGLSEKTAGCITHPICIKDGDRVKVREIFRSPTCSIIDRAGIGKYCAVCYKYEGVPDVKLQVATFDDDPEQALGEGTSVGLNEWQEMFLANQTENASVCSSRRRYHPDVIRWSIELYCRSPAAYHHIVSSKALILPCSKTIQRYRNYIKPEPGINKLAIQEIDRVMKHHEYLPSFLTLDEMKIRENLVVSNGKLVGFIDPSFTAPRYKLATHILVFYLRTVKGEISLPLAWYPTHVTSPTDLCLIFWKLLGECESRNVQVHAVIADGMSTNRKFFKLIGGVDTIPLDSAFTAPNPYGRSRPILLWSDPPHLLKTLRNALYSSKPSGTKYMCRDGNDILWTHIAKLYENEKYTLMLRRCRLTEAHVRLNSYSKMKVNLARDIFSYEVGKNLETMEGAKGTSKFILLINSWFEIANCGVRNPIRSVEDPRIESLKKFVDEMLRWKREVDNFAQPKRILPLATLEGLIFTTRNMVFLCERLLCQMEYLCLRTFSQDILEAFFGNLRNLGRFSQNPDLSEVGYGVLHITQRKSIKKIKGGNTTYGSRNAWTEVCDVPMVKRARATGRLCCFTTAEYFNGILDFYPDFPSTSEAD